MVDCDCHSRKVMPMKNVSITIHVDTTGTVTSTADTLVCEDGRSFVRLSLDGGSSILMSHSTALGIVAALTANDAKPGIGTRY